MLALVPLEVVVEPALRGPETVRQSVTVETSHWTCVTLPLYLFDTRGAERRQREHTTSFLFSFLRSFLCIVEIRYRGISHPAGQQLHLHVKQ